MILYNWLDQRIHLLCQIIAKANRTYVPKKDDDSHTNLSFDSISKSIYGRWIKEGDTRIIMRLNLLEQTFEWIDENYQVIQSYNFEQKKIATIEQEIKDNLSLLGLDSKGFSDKLHFEISTYDFANEKMEPLGKDGVNQWMMSRELANDTCQAVLGYLQKKGEVRIWPHHFDTGIYIQPNSEIGIGFGLAMEDSLLNEPYFYLAGYAQKDSIHHDDLTELTYGQWKITEDWKGALLPLTELNGLPYYQQKQRVVEFSRIAIGWYFK